jgi:hypothetical protein
MIEPPGAAGTVASLLSLIGVDMAILWQRTGNVKMAELPAAVKFAKSVAGYLNEKYSLKVEVATPLAGVSSRVMWLSRFDSLAMMEQLLGKLAQDAGYNKLVAEGTKGVFVDAATSDELWKVH